MWFKLTICGVEYKRFIIDFRKVLVNDINELFENNKTKRVRINYETADLSIVEMKIQLFAN